MSRTPRGRTWPVAWTSFPVCWLLMVVASPRMHQPASYQEWSRSSVASLLGDRVRPPGLPPLPLASRHVGHTRSAPTRAACPAGWLVPSEGALLLDCAIPCKARGIQKGSARLESGQVNRTNPASASLFFCIPSHGRGPERGTAERGGEQQTTEFSSGRNEGTANGMLHSSARRAVRRGGPGRKAKRPKGPAVTVHVLSPSNLKSLCRDVAPLGDRRGCSRKMKVEGQVLLRRKARRPSRRVYSIACVALKPGPRTGGGRH